MHLTQLKLSLKYKMTNIEIGGVELFGFERKKYKGDIQDSNAELYICFVIRHEGDLMHTEILCFFLS